MSYRWIFVVHGGIDGYSRLPVYLKCSTTNTSGEVLKYTSLRLLVLMEIHSKFDLIWGAKISGLLNICGLCSM